MSAKLYEDEPYFRTAASSSEDEEMDINNKQIFKSVDDEEDRLRKALLEKQKIREQKRDAKALSLPEECRFQHNLKRRERQQLSMSYQETATRVSKRDNRKDHVYSDGTHRKYGEGHLKKYEDYQKTSSERKLKIDRELSAPSSSSGRHRHHREGQQQFKEDYEETKRMRLEEKGRRIHHYGDYRLDYGHPLQKLQERHREHSSSKEMKRSMELRGGKKHSSSFTAATTRLLDTKNESVSGSSSSSSSSVLTGGDEQKQALAQHRYHRSKKSHHRHQQQSTSFEGISSSVLPEKQGVLEEGEKSPTPLLGMDNSNSPSPQLETETTSFPSAAESRVMSEEEQVEIGDRLMAEKNDNNNDEHEDADREKESIFVSRPPIFRPGRFHYDDDEDEGNEYDSDGGRHYYSPTTASLIGNNNDEGDQEEENGDEISPLSDEEKMMFENLTDEERLLLTPDTRDRMEHEWQMRLIKKLPIYYPGISGCRSINEFNCDFRISEGTFGVVYRATEKRTDEIVALKRLKMEKEQQGFPITSLREINMLLKCNHRNIIRVKEVVVGSNMDRIYMVMEYVEHDLKIRMDMMHKQGSRFSIPQVKTMLLHLLRGVEHLHKEWIIHRDLKPSNLLISNRGILKIGDFGLAREYGEPLKPYTPVVVTLWYRAPELLLGSKLYSTPIDMWSVGCIFGEFLKMQPIFPGHGELDQMNRIFKEIGTPNETIWPGCSELPGMKQGVFADYPFNQLNKKFAAEFTEKDKDVGLELLKRLLAASPDPKRRIPVEEALKSQWFKNDPLPLDPSLFSTWPTTRPTAPTAEEMAARVAAAIGGAHQNQQQQRSSDPLKERPNQHSLSAEANRRSSGAVSSAGPGFLLKFDPPKFK